MRLVLQSDYEVSPNSLLILCHPNDYNKTKEMLERGVILKAQPEIVDGLAVDCHAISAAKEDLSERT